MSEAKYTIKYELMTEIHNSFNPLNNIRVFISSTFRDMNVERDYLTNKIFPRIQYEAKSKGINIKFIDLRWGCTEEDESIRNGRIVETCFQEIDNCRPFFIGLLGERYGWIPQYEDLGNFQEYLLHKYECIKDDLDRELSITEMEMRYAALRNNDLGYAHFYIRSPQFQTPYEYREIQGSAASIKLQKLKDLIQSQDKYPVDIYASEEALGDLVYKDLAKIVEKMAIRNDDVAQMEHNLYEFEITSRTENYVADPLFEQKIQKWINSPSKLLVISGDELMGKSTHMCNFLKNYRNSQSAVKTVYHDVGTKQIYNTDSVEMMMSHITSEFALLYGWKSDPMQMTGCLWGFFKFLFTVIWRCVTLDFQLAFTNKNRDDIQSDLVMKISEDSNSFTSQSSRQFLKICEKIKRKNDPIILFLDNLDLLSDKEGLCIASFLRLLPDNIRCVVSVRKSSVVETVLNLEMKADKISIRGFDMTMAKDYTIKYLSAYGKRLNEMQLNTLLSGFYVRYPYKLSMVLDRLVSFGSFECLDKEIVDFASLDNNTFLTRKIISDLINEFEGQFEKNPFISSICAIVISHKGLTEDEIENILELKPIEWSTIRGHLLSLCLCIDNKYKIRDKDVVEAVLEIIPFEIKSEVLSKSISYFETLIDYKHRQSYENALGIPDSGKVLEDSWLNQRQSEELPFLYIQSSEYNKLFKYVKYVYNDSFFSTADRTMYWQALYEKGYSMSHRTEIYGEKLVPLKIDFYNYYSNLLEIAKALRHQNDAQWAASCREHYMSEDIKKIVPEIDASHYKKVEQMFSEGKYRECIEFGMEHKASDLFVDIQINMLIMNSYKMLGDYRNAMDLGRKQMDKIKSLPDMNMSMIADTTIYYCSICADCADENNVQKYIGFLDEIYDYQISSGFENISTYLMLIAYAKLYLKLKQYRLAIRYYNDAYRASIVVYGKDSYNTYVILGALGIAQRMAGDYVDADFSLDSSINKISQISPNDNLLYEMLINRYIILYNVGRYSEALSLLEKAKIIYGNFQGKQQQDIDWINQQIENTHQHIS